MRMRIDVLYVLKHSKTLMFIGYERSDQVNCVGVDLGRATNHKP